MRMGTLILCAAVGCVVSATGREWTSKDGRKVEADLVSYNEQTGALTLAKEGGREFTLNIEQLSSADQDFLANRSVETNSDAEAPKVDASMPDAEAGTTKTFSSEGEYNLSYHCYYPKNYISGKKYPVLILFSPNGKGQGVMNKFLPVGDEHDWLIVGCDKFKNNLDEDDCEDWFKEVLPSIEKNVPLNPERMYLGGMSGGAWRAYHYSAMFDRPWKGIVACGGWLGGSEYEGMKYARKMAVAMVNGDDDSGANGWVDRDTSELKGRSCKVEVFNFPGGHTIAPSEVLSEAVAWVIKNTRD